MYNFVNENYDIFIIEVCILGRDWWEVIIVNRDIILAERDPVQRRICAALEGGGVNFLYQFKF